ncbi:MAG TPA: DUF1848 domain-containing protein [Clostridia bacterium]|nr:DUF1848 domain-containing protein [Clostridia bacterium]
MIVSASRRTDIPARYSEWLFNRLREGYACTRSPFDPAKIGRISLSPEVVDGIVFWTKNPAPMLPRLSELRPYTYYFQFTLTPYGKDIEENIPSKENAVIPAFRELSREIGRERVVWRYDPILLTERYTIDFHLEAFASLAKALEGYTGRCVISFLDPYRSIRGVMRELGMRAPEEDEMRRLAKRLAETAAKHHIALEACAEALDLSECGVARTHCVDKALFERLLGCRLDAGRDMNQRKECGCMESVDIGMYDTCPNGCAYCYANHNAAAVARNIAAHDPASPLLCGHIGPGDGVTEREMRPFRDGQIGFRI